MTLDIIVFILCILAFVRGWQKGLLWAICSFIGVFLAIFISLKLSHIVANYLFTQHMVTGNYVLLLSFVGIFLITIFTFRMLIKLVEKILDKMFLGNINKLLGGLLYAFFSVFVMSCFLWLANNVKLINKDIETSSKTIEYINPIAPYTIQKVQAYLPYCKNLLEEIKDYANKVNERTDKYLPGTK